MAKKALSRVPVGISKPIEEVILSHLEMTKVELERIKESPALNGGFTNLQSAVANMAEDVSETKNKVESLHKAVYEPDHGLYARVKEMLPAEEFKAVEVDVTELMAWKDADEKFKATLVTDTKEHAKLVAEHTANIDSLQSFKDNVYKAGKWLAVALVGSALTVISKLLFEVFAGHVKLIP